MKLKDLYEQYELKKNESIISTDKYILFTTNKYDIILLSDEYHIDLGGFIPEDEEIQWNISDTQINTSDKIINFFENNYETIYRYNYNSNTSNTPKEIHDTLAMVCDIKNYGGYSGWKILDSKFFFNDNETMFDDYNRLQSNKTHINCIELLYQKNNDFIASYNKLTFKRDDKTQHFVIDKRIESISYTLIINAYYRNKG